MENKILNNDPIYTVNDIRNYLKVGRDAAYAVMNDPELKSFCVGGRNKRVRYSQLISFLEQSSDKEVS